MKAKRAQLAKTHRNRSSSSMNFIEQIEREVDAFFSQQFDPLQELKDQYKRMDKDWEKADNDEQRIKNDYDSLYLSHLLDLAEWWKNVGRKKFEYIFLAVPSIMSLPASNAHQERTFSMCTHFNDELRGRLRDDKFEQSVIIAVNKGFTKIKVPTEEEATVIIAETVSQIEGATGVEREDALESLGIANIEATAFQENVHGDLTTPRRLSF